VDFTLVDPIARAVLYEGYLLYPYRKSSLKNCRPSPFGALVPKAYSLANGDIEPWSMQTEFLIRGDERATLQGLVRFLRSDGREAIEHEIVIPEIRVRDLCPGTTQVANDKTMAHGVGRRLSAEQIERAPICSGSPTRQRGPSLAYASGFHCEIADTAVVRDALFKVRLRIENLTPIQDDIAAHTMLSTHAVLATSGGRFLSLIDPPSDARAAAETCQNRGVWPVLVGDRDRHDMILAAPIILYDFPQIAPESPGDLYDASEIDELLSLRILTLTDAEKHAMKADARTRDLLERTEKLADDQFRGLHGAMRELRIDAKESLRPGDRVRLQPSAARSASQRDILDLALEGMSATIASVEQDFEGRVLYTVTLDDDPGRDLGQVGKPGHRFFFCRDERESLAGDG
jgi:hypothetical protein